MNTSEKWSSESKRFSVPWRYVIVNIICIDWNYFRVNNKQYKDFQSQALVHFLENEEKRRDAPEGGWNSSYGLN